MKFNREFTMFEGGDVLINGRTVYAPQQRVRIIRAVGHHDDDRFKIDLTNLGSTDVDGCDLHPHPEAHATNVEFLTDLCNNGSTAMVQAFILEGAARYAEQLLAAYAKGEKVGNPFINGDAWANTAKEVQAAIQAHLKS